jgi:RNA polymerase sigma-70 factor (ECF subfamily)
MGSETSLSLLVQLRDVGAPYAWNRLVELYTPLLFYWARRLGLSPQDAEDLVQEVFATLVEKLPAFTYDSQKSFRGWLRRILINKWHDRQRRRKLPLETGSESDLSEVRDDGDSPFWEAEHRRYIARRAMELMRSEFEPTTWKACWAFVVEGKTGLEVASELGISEAAVYIAKCRVLRRLRQEMADFLV